MVNSKINLSRIVIVPVVFIMASCVSQPAFLTAQDSSSLQKSADFNECAKLADEKDLRFRTHIAREFGRIGDYVVGRRFTNNVNECMQKKGYSDFDMDKKNYSTIE